MANPRVLMKHRGKTFHFASLFFTKETAEKAREIYWLCRQLDDQVDSPHPTLTPPQRLERMTELLDRHRHTATYRFPASQVALDHLRAGFIFDLSRGKIKNLEALMTYAYQVAGTVGVLMTPFLIEKRYDPCDIIILRHAISLGMGMQLTNICRDVVEDYQAGRQYLPESLCGRITKRRLQDRDHRLQVHDSMLFLLDIADQLYAFGLEGTHYLQPSAARTIRVAALCYQQIGLRLRRIPYLPAHERMTVPLRKKVTLAARAVLPRKTQRFSVAPDAEWLHHWIGQWLEDYRKARYAA